MFGSKWAFTVFCNQFFGLWALEEVAGCEPTVAPQDQMGYIHIWKLVVEMTLKRNWDELAEPLALFACEEYKLPAVRAECFGCRVRDADDGFGEPSHLLEPPWGWPSSSYMSRFSMCLSLVRQYHSIMFCFSLLCYLWSQSNQIHGKELLNLKSWITCVVWQDVTCYQAVFMLDQFTCFKLFVLNFLNKTL